VTKGAIKTTTIRTGFTACEETWVVIMWGCDHVGHGAEGFLFWSGCWPWRCRLERQRMWGGEFHAQTFLQNCRPAGTWTAG